MQIVFEVIIDTDEAESGELEQAISNALEVLRLPNGDTLYVIDKIVRIII